MTLEIVDTSAEGVQHLFEWSGEGRGRDAGCRFCLYWEEPDRSRWPADLSERLQMKQEWFRRVSAEVGVCGRVALIEGEPVGYSQFAPASYLPTARDYSCGPPGADALFVSCLYVHRRRGEGVGSALLGDVVREARTRGVAVESFAARGSRNNPSGPLEFWSGHAFRVVREDDRFALVRREPR